MPFANLYVSSFTPSWSNVKNLLAEKRDYVNNAQNAAGNFVQYSLFFFFYFMLPYKYDAQAQKPLYLKGRT